MFSKSYNQLKNVLLVVLVSLVTNISAQSQSSKISTSDIDHFWEAFDSIQNTDNIDLKFQYINDLYINKGSRGLKAFMEMRDYNDSLYIKLITAFPKFWHSVRQNTLSIKEKREDLNQAVQKLKSLYPELKKSEMFFTIGGLRSGGTTTADMVLIGAEIVAATSQTDVSEFKNDWLKNVFAEQSLDNIVSMNIHEYVHTQQIQKTGKKLLGQVIREGACDFVAELVLEKPLQRKYISYGNEHLDSLKVAFKKEMLSEDYSNWLYNGGKKGESADLGYFIGYQICKSYYNQSSDKIEAIKQIIELDYSDDTAAQRFLTESGFLE